jgi:hypothetical protein
MYFLFSGEGATDLGMCADEALACEGDRYKHGPMTVMVDRIVEQRQSYSLLETGYYGFVSRGALEARASELKSVRKSLGLPGKRRARETHYFFRNARVLAKIAAERQAELEDDVVAVLFRDSDAATAGRGSWEQKRRSMLDGFEQEGFTRGVPMIPKPTSEAWLLCALQQNPYRDCAALEDRSGSRSSPNSLKGELAERHGHDPSREKLCELVSDATINVDRIEMPSFRAFRERLEEVI